MLRSLARVSEMFNVTQYNFLFSRISSKLERIFFLTMFFEMFLLVITISLCAFEAVKEENYFSSKFNARSNLLVCVTSEVFAFSLLGEQIQHESQLVAESMYNSYWYKIYYSTKNPTVLKNFKSLFLITTMRANKKVKISAAGIVTMSYETFLKAS